MHVTWVACKSLTNNSIELEVGLAVALYPEQLLARSVFGAMASEAKESIITVV